MRKLFVGALFVGALCAQQWSSLPGTAVNTACPADGTSGSLCTGDPNTCGSTVGGPYKYSNCHQVVDAWGGGVARTKPGAESIILFGGGHADYGGNEVYQINVGTNPGATRITNPDYIDYTWYNPTLSTITLTVNVGGTGNTTVTTTTGDFTKIALNPTGTTTLQGFWVSIGTGYFLVKSVESATSMTLYWGPTSPLTGATLTLFSGRDKSVFPNGDPVSVHTYAGMAYIDQNNKYFPDSIVSCGGAAYGNGNHLSLCWLLNLSGTPTWKLIMPSSSGLQPSGGVSAPAPQAVYDPSTGRVYLLWDGYLAYLDLSTCTGSGPLTCTYTQTSVGSEIGWQTPVLDPVRHRIFAMGCGETPCSGGVAYTVDLTAGSQPVNVTSSLAASCAGLVNSEAPGLAYDFRLDQYIGWPLNGGGTIYLINPSTFNCTTVPFGGTAPSTNSAFVNGIYNRMFYFPSLGKLALIYDGVSNAYALQLDPMGIGNPQQPYACVDHDGDGYGVGPLKVGPFTDLVIDGTTSTIVSSASYTFTSANVAQFITITGGTGFTPQTVMIASVSGGKATLASSAGVIGSAGGAWKIDGCLGPDADDENVSLHTTADAISTYGNAVAVYNRKRYAPQRYWLISPSGSDTGTPTPYTPAQFAACTSTTAPTCSTAYATQNYIKTSIQPGDAVVFRGGSYSERLAISGGSTGQGVTGTWVYYLAYPGEVPLFTGTFIDTCLAGCTNGLAYENNYWVVDGLALAGYVNGGLSSHGILRHLTVQNGYCMWGFQDLHDIAITDSYCSNPNNTHGIYMGSRDYPSSGFTFQRNVIPHNNWNGIHLNGRVSNALITDNIIHSNLNAGIEFDNGTSHSTIASNLIFNNARAGLIFAIYEGQDCTVAPLLYCPWDENYNVIENNTIYNSGSDFQGNGSAQGAIYFGSQDPAIPRDLGHQTIRNNIFYGGVDAGHLPIRQDFVSTNGYAGETGWWKTNTLDHNIIKSLTDTTTNVLEWEDHAAPPQPAFYYSCAQLGAISNFVNGASIDCQNVVPQFTDVSPNYYNNVSRFNFTLASGSPAIHGGAAPSLAQFDLSGTPFALTASLGSYEVATSSSSPPPPPPPPSKNACDLNGDGVVNSLDVQLAINQVTGASACTSASLEGTGLCSIVDVQRIVNASLGGACKTGQ